jgi:hypothetical protein
MTMLTLTSCSENYSVGERVGYVTQVSQTGLIFKTYEGHLNVTQTGMNTGASFDFSLDRDGYNPLLLPQLLDAASKGYKVKLHYHEVLGYNWWSNRGQTNHFVDKVEKTSDQLGTQPTQ